MIFTLEKTPSNEPIIKPTRYSSIDAWELHSMITSSYPNQSIVIVNFNGYKNAIMLSSKHASVDNYSKWEEQLKNKFPHNTIIFHRGHNYIYARIDAIEIGRYVLSGNFGQIY